MSRKKTTLAFLILALVVVSASAFLIYRHYFQPTKLTFPSGHENRIMIGNREIKIEIADTPARWHKGLSGRPSLCADCGLLFLFPDKAPRTFVMREMNFPLDLIWIKNGIIVKIDENAPPEGRDFSNRYQSPGPVDMALELNAGFCANNNIKANDLLQLPI
jgi:hypothetical protein